MKKRIWALLLGICMICSLIVVPAAADDWAGGAKVEMRSEVGPGRNGDNAEINADKMLASSNKIHNYKYLDIGVRLGVEDTTATIKVNAPEFYAAMYDALHDARGNNHTADAGNAVYNRRAVCFSGAVKADFGTNTSLFVVGLQFNKPNDAVAFQVDETGLGSGYGNTYYDLEAAGGYTATGPGDVYEVNHPANGGSSSGNCQLLIYRSIAEYTDGTKFYKLKEPGTLSSIKIKWYKKDLGAQSSTNVTIDGGSTKAVKLDAGTEVDYTIKLEVDKDLSRCYNPNLALRPTYGEGVRLSNGADAEWGGDQAGTQEAKYRYELLGVKSVTSEPSADGYTATVTMDTSTYASWLSSALSVKDVEGQGNKNRDFWLAQNIAQGGKTCLFSSNALSVGIAVTPPAGATHYTLDSVQKGCLSQQHPVKVGTLFKNVPNDGAPGDDDLSPLVILYPGITEPWNEEEQTYKLKDNGAQLGTNYTLTWFTCGHDENVDHGTCDPVEIGSTKIVIKMAHYVPPAAPPAYAPPEPPAKTEQNPDGSTTTTQTKSDGTVVETTKSPDGSSQSVETKKDGTVTTKTEDAQGNKTETVEKPDGSSSVKTQDAKGNKSEVVKDAEGTTTTKVEQADGSKSETVEQADGSLTHTAKQADGTSATAEKTAEGVMTAKTTVSREAVTEAASSGEAVAIPIPAVPVAASSAQASTVEVVLPASTSAKVSIPVAETKPGTVAVIVKADGTEEVVKTSIAADGSLNVPLEGGATLKIVDNSRKFEDTTGTWSEGAVDFVTARELFNGTGGDAFSPTTNMSKSMLITVLARLDGQDTAKGSTWDEVGLAWGKEKGITDGAAPSKDISRQELAVMLYRYAGSPIVEGDLSAFPDGADVGGWAEQAMIWATQHGILGANGVLMAASSASRAEVSQMLLNYVAALAK